MTSVLNKFSDRGYLIIDDVIDNQELALLVDRCESELHCKVGTRNLLGRPWVKSLGEKLRYNRHISKLLPKDAVAVQCNYFRKNTAHNWYVTLHRDISIPVIKKIESDEWSGWSTKEGQLYAQPPRAVLESLVAIRIHFEDNDKNNGALQVIPGSHLGENSKSEEFICQVRKKGALLMRPLILHKSPKLKFGTRRVLHFVFGPPVLPNGAEWPDCL